MISVRDALGQVLQNLPSMGAEQIALPQAYGRVLAVPIRALRDVPPFRNSAMDGYAVRVEDVVEAGPSGPVRLRILEMIGAGAVPSQTVTPGTATKIMTGAPMPEGADAVVRVEDTVEAANSVEIHVAVKAGTSVRAAGEDIRAGEVVLGVGRRLRPADIGLLASIGLATVRVSCRPRVTIVTTGDELVDIGQPLKRGQIVNSNAYTLAAAVEEAGALPVIVGVVRDQPDRIRAAFSEACRADVVLSTGGVSVGSFDYVREILHGLGYQERFWKVAQRPGKPLTFGLRGDTPIFGLPGNPVSCLVCFYVYVLPALRKMMALENVYLATTAATMAKAVTKAPGLTEFVRCTLEGQPEDYQARSTGSQGSGVLRSLSLGDGLIVGPAEVSILEQGRRVRVIMLNAARSDSVSPV